MWDPEHSGSGAVSEPNGENKPPPTHTPLAVWDGWGETEGFTHFPDKKPVERNARRLETQKPYGSINPYLAPGVWFQKSQPLVYIGLCFILAIPARVFVSGIRMSSGTRPSARRVLR
jgi:hypothetical protein